MYIPSIYSVLFLLAALVSIYAGFRVYKLDSESILNKTFLLMCFSASIWSFGFSMANSANILTDAIMWRRFSAIGGASVFTVSLNFLLLVISNARKEKFNKFLLIMHFPTIVNIYIFSLSSKFASIQYNLIKNDFGWINVAKSNIWTYFYYASTIVYILIILNVIWQSKNKIKNVNEKKQAFVVFVSILTSFTLGFFIDVFAVNIFNIQMPQTAPILILFPIATIYQSIINYGMFGTNHTKKETSIISGRQQDKIITYLSIASFAGSIINYLSVYYSSDINVSNNIFKALGKSSMLFILSISLVFIKKVKDEQLKTRLTTIFLVSSIPITTYQFYTYSSSTIWVLPIVIIISSLLFNKRVMLVSSTAVAIVSQLFLWNASGSSVIIIDGFEFLNRILVYFIVFVLGLYINKVYILKLEEIENQVRFQKMISNVSLDFVGLNFDNYNDKINYLLKEIGEFFNVDRTYLFSVNNTNHTMTYTNEWCNKGIKPEVMTIEEIPLEVFSWWISELKTKNQVYINDVNKMPENAKAEQDQLIRQKVKSLISVPVKSNGEIIAFIGIDSIKNYKEWPQNKINLLNIMANILSNGLAKVKADNEVQNRAYYDALTDLPNRYAFEKTVNKTLNNQLDTSSKIAVMFIDLDDFKAVNDTICHRGGDKLLLEISKRLKASVSENDFVSRFGGDEFMIMVNYNDHEITIDQIAQKIMSAFIKPFRISDKEFFITASAGIANYPIDGTDSETLIKNADIAMYKAKEKGKNGYAISSKKIKQEIADNIELSNDLFKSIENNELIVYYQPQVDLRTNKIIGTEALLRWDHPSRGLICPAIFIPIAEKNGFINQIGDYVLETACRQNKEWHDLGFKDLHVAINLSAVEIMNPMVAANIEAIIRKTKIDPKYVELEVTESVAISEPEYVLDTLNKIKAIGVSIAIDDFGTEYSSLSRLKQIPIDLIKIDMQFIQGIENNAKDKAITMSIINLAKSLNLEVLAEGVETKNQLDYLIEKDCDYVQGYYFYKPLSKEAMTNVFKDL